MDSQQLKAVTLFSMGLMLVGSYLILSWVFPTAEAEKRAGQQYTAFFADLRDNYTCSRIDKGCVIGGFLYNPCPQQFNLSLTNRTG